MKWAKYLSVYSVINTSFLISIRRAYSFLIFCGTTWGWKGHLSDYPTYLISVVFPSKYEEADTWGDTSSEYMTSQYLQRSSSTAKSLISGEDELIGQLLLDGGKVLAYESIRAEKACVSIFVILEASDLKDIAFFLEAIISLSNKNNLLYWFKMKDSPYCLSLGLITETTDMKLISSHPEQSNLRGGKLILSSHSSSCRTLLHQTGRCMSEKLQCDLLCTQVLHEFYAISETNYPSLDVKIRNLIAASSPQIVIFPNRE